MQIKVGDNSVVQIQNNVTGSSQQGRISTNDFQKIEQTLQDIKNARDKIVQYLSFEQTDDLQQDIEILEKAMKKKEPNISVIKPIYKGIIDTLKSVPGNVIANLIVSGLPEINF